MANEHITGATGIAPPADAPREVSQPLRADAGSILDTDGVLHRPLDKARQNERTLAPLTYKDSIAQAAAELAGTANPHEVRAPAPVQPAHAPIKAAVVPPAQSRAPEPTMSAASNTDSPSRGVPGTAHSPFRDPTKDPLRVEGGFGGGSGEYFALDGTELRECVAYLLGDLFDQAENDMRIVGLSEDRVAALTLTLAIPDRGDSGEVGFDLVRTRGNPDGDLVQAIDALFAAFMAEIKSDLRFGIAAAYPEYALTLTLGVTAYPGDAGFTLLRHRREKNEFGEVETPPDALREELGLTVPRRQIALSGPLGPLSSDVRI